MGHARSVMTIFVRRARTRDYSSAVHANPRRVGNLARNKASSAVTTISRGADTPSFSPGLEKLRCRPRTPESWNSGQCASRPIPDGAVGRARHGASFTVSALLDLAAADCPKRAKPTRYDCCAVHRIKRRTKGCAEPRSAIRPMPLLRPRRRVPLSGSRTPKAKAKAIAGSRAGRRSWSCISARLRFAAVALIPSPSVSEPHPLPALLPGRLGLT